jgi:hypothetical protein
MLQTVGLFIGLTIIAWLMIEGFAMRINRNI